MATKKNILVLRTCSASMISSNNFKWPGEGAVVCPDWEPTDACGHGLHGLPWGVGDGNLLDWSNGAWWLVVSVSSRNLRMGKGELKDKCKFSRGVVEFCGDRIGAVAYLAAHDPQHVTRRCVGAVVTAGDSGTATAGNGGTATAGWGGTATAGDRGTA